MRPHDDDRREKSRVHFLQGIAPFVHADPVLIITRNHFSELSVFLKEPRTLLSHVQEDRERLENLISNDNSEDLLIYKSANVLILIMKTRNLEITWKIYFMSMYDIMIGYYIDMIYL